MTHEEKAREIALWLYGPDEGMSEGLVRTLIDKITEALASAEKKGREEGQLAVNNMPNGYWHDKGWNEAITAAVKVAQDYMPSEECKLALCCNQDAVKAGKRPYVGSQEMNGVDWASNEIASKIEELRKG